MDAPLRQSHPAVGRDRTFCSPVQLQVVGLTGIPVQTAGEDGSTCPFGECAYYCTTSTRLWPHVARADAGVRADPVARLGCFWEAILDSVHKRHGWPIVREILFADMPGGVRGASPLAPDVADRIWRRGAVPLRPARLPTSRIAPASPLAPLLQHLRERASAGRSAGAFDGASDATGPLSDIEARRPGRAARGTRGDTSSDLPPPLPP
jgi:hypothetical protein